MTDPTEDACPHCSPTHERPESRPWGVYVASQRDGDGQPTHLVVQPSNGAHVAQSDADWLWQLIRDYRPLPASETEWGIQHGSGHVITVRNEAEARSMRSMTPVCRQVGPWIPVSDPTEEAEK